MDEPKGNRGSPTPPDGTGLLWRKDPEDGAWDYQGPDGQWHRFQEANEPSSATRAVPPLSEFGETGAAANQDLPPPAHGPYQTMVGSQYPLPTIPRTSDAKSSSVISRHRLIAILLCVAVLAVGGLVVAFIVRASHTASYNEGYHVGYSDGTRGIRGLTLTSITSTLNNTAQWVCGRIVQATPNGTTRNEWVTGCEAGAISGNNSGKRGGGG